MIYIKARKQLSDKSISISLRMKENGMHYGVKDHSYPAVMRMPSYERPLGIVVPEAIRKEITDKSIPSSDGSDMILPADVDLSKDLRDFIDKCWLEIKLKDKEIF